MLPLALCAGLSARAAETLEIDATHSAVLFSWNHLGISNPVARLEKIEGQVRLDRTDPARCSVSVTLPLEGLRTGVDALDRRLKGEDFLDAARYPAITFQSTGVRMTGPKRFKLAGTLSVHGIARPVVLDAKVNDVALNGFSGALTAGFDADVVLRRSDFGVARYVPAVSDELTVHITLHAEPPE
jgi:polyisoprenoid-binding protein YceI